jgi:hypothetical protein
MTITYANGKTIKAALVVGDDKWMRLVLAGTDDVTEFTKRSGTWVSEDCEPVQVQFGFSDRANHAYKEEDFACSHELAAQLIHMLLNPEEEEEEVPTIPAPSVDSAAALLVA